MLINELAKLSGVSKRALRYYDEIGLLIPSEIGENGYRHYSDADIDRLQQILFYRELDFKLEEIKKFLDAPEFNVNEALRNQHELLERKRSYLDGLIKTIKNTIQVMEGEKMMTNEQKFEAFKNKMIEDNDKQYGEEVREKYGEEQILASYGKLKNMTEDQYKSVNQLEQMLFERLKEAMVSGDASAEVAMEAAELHKRWLSFYWAKYTPQAHAGLAQMYLHDERFTAYYDERVGKGATQFLHDAIMEYVK
ncbi:MerR family transcriptional regulator [Solibacillus sp. R5-41]|uniref:MerR family transcriptional regulator n=1 Tax=Solibacillus sp. R5-41 TaxID=2048654 RepID=UPI000C1299CA|nr:MerR family transcriptional regulator [Solibacillus sp. R5-41]ATP41538.1 MerR family transcriptional regulator [Solibacillus sp. R5-41]